MGTADKAWREVRRQRSERAIVESTNAFLDELWPDLRQLGLSRKSSRRYAPPSVAVCESFADRWLAGKCVVKLTADPDYEWQIDIRVCPMRNVKRMLYGSHSSTLFGAQFTDPVVYLRATIIHEIQHAIDEVDGRDIEKHDAWFVKRLGRLEGLFSPLHLG